jgi:hypothetical protein
MGYPVITGHQVTTGDQFQMAHQYSATGQPMLLGPLQPASAHGPVMAVQHGVFAGTPMTSGHLNVAGQSGKHISDCKIKLHVYRILMLPTLLRVVHRY